MLDEVRVPGRHQARGTPEEVRARARAAGRRHVMNDPVSRELVGQGATYEEASDVCGGAKLRSEGTRARHRGLVRTSAPPQRGGRRAEGPRGVDPLSGDRQGGGP